MHILKPQTLTAESFAPYGDVIAFDQSRQIPINQGLTTRFHDLFDIDCDSQHGKSIVNVFRTSPLPLPHRVEIMERHPLGSQAFLPMDQAPFPVLVAKPGENPVAEDLRLFMTNGFQGINFHKNTWHHFQIVTGHTRDFLVIDRGGPGNNLEEIRISDEVILVEGFDQVAE